MMMIIMIIILFIPLFLFHIRFPWSKMKKIHLNLLKKQTKTKQKTNKHPYIYIYIQGCHFEDLRIWSQLPFCHLRFRIRIFLQHISCVSMTVFFPAKSKPFKKIKWKRNRKKWNYNWPEFQLSCVKIIRRNSGSNVTQEFRLFISTHRSVEMPYLSKNIPSLLSNRNAPFPLASQLVTWPHVSHPLMCPCENQLSMTL